jgi:hypothetical protein
LWIEAADTTIKLSNFMVGADNKNPYVRFNNKKPDYVKPLRFIGEVGIVTEKPGPTIKSRLPDRGSLCVFVGYTSNCARNLYRIISTNTGKESIARDI